MNLSEVFEDSLQHAVWLTGADAAAVELARQLIARLESADSREFTAFGKLLNDVLKDLGMTVAGRTGKAEPEREVNRLDAIRTAAALRQSETATGNKTSKASKQN